MISRVGGVQRGRATTRKRLRGYAASRQAYDRRRRAVPLSTESRDWRDMVRQDPCAYCNGPGGMADHIESLGGDGENTWENFTGACRPCNGAKRERPLLEFLLRSVR